MRLVGLVGIYICGCTVSDPGWAYALRSAQQVDGGGFETSAHSLHVVTSASVFRGTLTVAYTLTNLSGTSVLMEPASATVLDSGHSSVPVSAQFEKCPLDGGAVVLDIGASCGVVLRGAVMVNRPERGHVEHLTVVQPFRLENREIEMLSLDFDVIPR